ncbi:MAG: tetratricopeptide repeat protein [Gemmatimonadota bacterium]
MRAARAVIAAAILAAILAPIAMAGPARAQGPDPAPGAAERHFEAGTAALSSGEAWEARELFERALFEGYPPGPGYSALADAWLALDNRAFYAREALERSLAADPENVEDWFRLAQVNLGLEGGDADPRARAALEEVLRRDPRHDEAFVLWSRMYLVPEDSREVAAILARHLEREYDPEIALRRIDVLADAGEFEAAREAIETFRRRVPQERHLSRLSHLAGVVLAALKETEAGAGYYFNGLRFARAETDLEPYYRDVEPLLSEAERKAWDTWPLERRRAFLIGWWNERNPLPFSDVNARWTEQLERNRIARAAYQWKKPVDKSKLVALGGRDTGMPVVDIRLDGRSLDDRGAFFLRHGTPDETDGVGVQECGFWLYRHEALGEDGEVAVNFESNEGSIIGSRGGQFFGNDCNFTTIPHTGRGLEYFAPFGLEANDKLRAQQMALDDFEQGLSTDTYEYRVEDVLPLNELPASFSYLRAATDFILYFSIPLREVELEDDQYRYRKGIVIYDARWNELIRRSEEADAAVARVPESDGRSEYYLIDMFRMRVRPGSYRFALQVDDLNGKGVGVVKGPLRVRRFSATGLELSDLILTNGAVQGDVPERFERYGLPVVPLPNGRFLPDEPIYLYFEAYHLSPGRDRELSFRIDYTVRAREIDRNAIERFFAGLRGLVGVHEEPGSITLSFERTIPWSGGSVWPEYLSFDPGALEPGTYTLEVAVTDHNLYDRRVETSRNFQIID